MLPVVPCSPVDRHRPPLVFVIVPNWNGGRDTIRCLESLLASDQAAFRAVLVDSRSTDDSTEHLEEWTNTRTTTVAYDRSQAVAGSVPERCHTAQQVHRLRAVATILGLDVQLVPVRAALPAHEHLRLECQDMMSDWDQALYEFLVDHKRVLLDEGETS